MNKKLPLIAGLLISSALCNVPASALEITENEGQANAETVVLPPSAPAPASADKTPPTAPVASKATSKALSEANDKTKNKSDSASSAATVDPKTPVASEVTTPVSADKKVFITDNAYVWMTRGPGKQYRLTGTARAGDEVTILNTQNGYHQIRLPSGKVGWIPKSEVQHETSFRAEVTMLRSENEALKYKLANIDSETARELKAAKSELSSLRQERDELAKKQAADSAKLAKIQERNEELESKLETKAQDMQLRWWKEGGLIAGIGALAGVILVYLPRPRRRREDYY